jgi:hypothetical protein
MNKSTLFKFKVAMASVMSAAILWAAQATAVDIAVSGFIRQEAAYKLTNDENPWNRGSALVSGEIPNQSQFLRNPANVAALIGTGLIPGVPSAAAGDPATVNAVMAGLTAPFQKQDLSMNNDWNLMATRAEVDFNINMNNNWTAFVKVRGFYQYDVFQDYGDPNHFEVENHGKCATSLEVCDDDYMIDLPSAYVDYQNGPLWVRVGNQQIAWGESIFFRVADVVNGLDLRRHSFLDFASEEYADKRVASPGIRASYNLTPNWELEGFAQMFQPSILAGSGSPYSIFASPFTVRNDIGFDKVDDQINGGLRLQGQIGDLGVQLFAVSRHNPDPIFRWGVGGQSSVNTMFEALGGGVNPFGDFGSQPFRSTSFPGATQPLGAGTLSALDWYESAHLLGLDGVAGLNALTTEYPGLTALGTFVIGHGPNYTMAEVSDILDTTFVLLGDLEADVVPIYAAENVFGGGFNYIFYSEPDTWLDQLVVRFEASYTPDKKFTNNVSRNFIESDEWVTGLAVEKYQRFSQNFPATFLSFQWMHKTDSDFLGRNLRTLGGDGHSPPTGGEKSNGWDAVAFAFQQPFPDLVWRFDFALLYDLNGSALIQPAVRYKPSNEWTFEAFASFIDAKDSAGSLAPVDWGDEVTLRIGYQF